MDQITLYVVTDIEADGPDPSRNSMLSFASVAIDGEGVVHSEFEATLVPRPDRKPNPDTIKWWESQPEAYLEARKDPRPAEAVMADFKAWVQALPGVKCFAARPLLFDGEWIDEYLKTFANARALVGPYREDQIFEGAGIDIPSFAAALFGLPYADVTKEKIAPLWLGGFPHTHRAIDDARGYAHFLGRLLRISRERAHHDDYRIEGVVESR